MARRKKTGFAAFLENFSITELLFHPGTLFVLCNIVMAMTAVWCWERYHDKIVDPEFTILTAQRIEINEQPAWAKTNLKEAILNSTEQPKSLLDPSLISDAVATCQTIGWIEKIQEMKKTRDGLKANFVYREPIAIVELRDETVPNWKQPAKLVPIDRTGTIMPDNLAVQGIQPSIFINHSDESLKRAPQHIGQLYQWTQWPDTRVTEAAAIIDILRTDLQAIGFSRVISRQLFDDVEDRTTPFELWTDKWENAATVLWGSSPGNELPNEAQWNQKLAALQNYIAQHGRLDSMTPRIIDVRSGNAIVVGAGAAVGSRVQFNVR